MLHTLLHNHTHAGVDYPAGAVVDLPPDAVAWLIAYETSLRGDLVKQQEESQKLIEESQKLIETYAGTSDE